MKLLSLFSLSLAVACQAENLRSAKVTKVVNDVKIYKGSATGQPATTGQTVSSSSSVTTGRRSRAELTFPDNTITRLGQNSVFSFRDGSRDVELERGSILLQVPKTAGGATIRTATVTAAITGTTSMFEYSPGHWVKLLTLEGTQKLYINGQDKPVLVPAGQMIVMRPDGRAIPAPITIDVSKLMATSPLAGTKVFGPLSKTSTSAINKTIGSQVSAKRMGALLPTNSFVAGPGAKNSATKIEVRQPTTPIPVDPNTGIPLPR